MQQTIIDKELLKNEAQGSFHEFIRILSSAREDRLYENEILNRPNYISRKIVGQRPAMAMEY